MIKAMKKRISNNKGLTLIELIIVIAIIGILAVIGVTQFSGMTDTAKESADEALIREVESAAKILAAQKGGTVTLTALDVTVGTNNTAANAKGLETLIDMPVGKLTSTKYTTATTPSNSDGGIDVTIDSTGKVTVTPKVQ